YQTLPPRWMEDIFEDDSIPQVALFKSMYQGYKTFDEIIDTLRVNDINLNSVATHFPLENNFALLPNPVVDKAIFLEYPDEWNNASMNYQIVDYKGNVVPQGRLSKRIQLKDDILPSVYYFLI